MSIDELTEHVASEIPDGYRLVFAITTNRRPLALLKDCEIISTGAGHDETIEEAVLRLLDKAKDDNDGTN